MKLIADSGSTKCDWVILSEHERIDTNTQGLNPFFHNSEFIEETIRKDVELNKVSGLVEEVFFYGSGCSSDKLREEVKKGIQRVFKKAKVNVEHDVLSAVHATYSGEPGVCCILGTGSNSVYYDGNSTREEVPSLGYILGDEASGCYFGKRLLIDFLYNELPFNLSSELRGQFRLDKKEILDRVLTKPHANVYLASFMPFISEHIKEPYIKNMLNEGFEDFLKRHVLCFEEAKDVPVHFVGSVAFYFKDQLEEAISGLNLKLGSVFQKPIDGLVAYHDNN